MKSGIIFGLHYSFIQNEQKVDLVMVKINNVGGWASVTAFVSLIPI